MQVLALTIRHRTELLSRLHPVTDLVQAHSVARLLRSGGAAHLIALTAKALRYSAIDAVKRARVATAVEVTGRRPGDAPALAANVDRIRAAPPWRPQFQFRYAIVAHAGVGKAVGRPTQKHRSGIISKSTLTLFAAFVLAKISLPAGKETPPALTRLLQPKRADERTQFAIERRRRYSALP